MIYLGTTGWDFKFWEHTFYPKNIIKKLQFYSKISAFTELRSTFSKLPTNEKVINWHNNTPDKFMFISRMPKDVTSTRNVDSSKIEMFFEIMKPLEFKHQMTIFHFSSKFQRNEANMEYLTSLISTVGDYFSGQLLIDIPNRSWQATEIKLLLHKHSACLVGQDRRPIPILMKDTSLYYLRLMGDTRTVPKSQLGKKALDRSADLKFWADHLKFIDKNTDSIFVVIDNHFSGNAIDDAFALSQELNRRKVNVKGFKQR